MEDLLVTCRLIYACSHCHAKGLKLPTVWLIRSPFGEHTCPQCGAKNRFFISPWLIFWPLFGLMALMEGREPVGRQPLKFTLLRCLLIFIIVGLLAPLVVYLFMYERITNNITLFVVPACSGAMLALIYWVNSLSHARTGKQKKNDKSDHG